MGQKSTLTVLVIDDDIGREATYRQFFTGYNNHKNSEYSISPIFSFDLLSACHELGNLRGAHVVLLDMVLTWPQRKGLLNSELDRVKPPTIALSSQFNDGKATETYLTLSQSFGVVLPILHWQSFIASSKNDQRMNELVDQFTAYLQAIFKTEPLYSLNRTEPLRIIHLTDLHFCNEINRKRYLSEISNTLDAAGLLGDFVAITGDVIDRGGVANYDKSKSWISGIFSSGWMNRASSNKLPSNRVLLVPGNHDFCEKLGISGFLKCNSEGKFDFDESESTKFENNSTWKHGMGPFLGFHEELTGWRVKHGDYPGFRLVSTFAAQGVHFLELWTEEYKIGKYKPFIDQSWLDQMLADVASEIKARCQVGDCIIVLCHRFSSDSSKQNLEIYRVLSQHFGSQAARYRVIILSGHSHMACVQHPPEQPNLLSIQGTTLSESKKEVNELAGFGVVTIFREGGNVDRCTVHNINRIGNGWEANSKYFECEFEEGRQWIVRAKSTP